MRSDHGGRAWVVSFAAILVLGLGIPGQAYHSASRSGSFFYERYLVCTDPLRLDHRCLGVGRGRAGILAALQLPGLGHRNNDHLLSPLHAAAWAAVLYNLSEAVAPARTLLGIAIQPGDRKKHLGMEKRAVQVEAAHVLARLGDQVSAGRIARLVIELETDGHGTLWSDALESLALLDPAAAGRYARDFLGRQRIESLRLSMPGGSDRLAVLPPLLAARQRDALPILQRLTAGQVPASGSGPYCSLAAARVRLGEEPFRSEVRRRMLGSYSFTWLANCDGDLVGSFGDLPTDVDLLLRHLGRPDAGMDFGVANTAYRQVLHLVGLLREGRAKDPAGAARARLRAGLAARARYPYLHDPSHRTYSLHFVALHAAAEAGLGDDLAARRLAALIEVASTRSEDHWYAAWLGARHGVNLRLPTVDRVLPGLILAGTRRGSGPRRQVLEHRLALLDALAARRDPGAPSFVPMLFDAESDVRERALFHLSRRRPAGACAAAIAAARGATGRMVQDGLLSLTAIGGCQVEVERLATERGLHESVHGMALELLAILRSPKLPALLRAAPAGSLLFRAALERARLIHQAR